MDADAQLVDLCLRGSEGAWEKLVREHSRLVYSACYRFTGRPEEARDLTQDVFLRVFRSLHTYRAESGRHVVLADLISSDRPSPWPLRHPLLTGLVFGGVMAVLLLLSLLRQL